MADVWGAALVAVISGGVGGGVISGLFRSQEWNRERAERRRDERRAVYLEFLQKMHEAVEAHQDAETALEEGYDQDQEAARLVANEAIAQAIHLANVIALVGPPWASGTAQRYLTALVSAGGSCTHDSLASEREDFTRAASAAMDDGPSVQEVLDDRIAAWRRRRRRVRGSRS